ncbi:MAG: hypothetical protein HY074_00210 [Deltaproteobacteria bacterium]|nr:hypothetical protein [Deltaproteobacteria bacterium]
MSIFTDDYIIDNWKRLFAMQRQAKAFERGAVVESLSVKKLLLLVYKPSRKDIDRVKVSKYGTLINERWGIEYFPDKVFDRSWNFRVIDQPEITIRLTTQSLDGGIVGLNSSVFDGPIFPASINLEAPDTRLIAAITELTKWWHTNKSRPPAERESVPVLPTSPKMLGKAYEPKYEDIFWLKCFRDKAKLSEYAKYLSDPLKENEIGNFSKRVRVRLKTVFRFLDPEFESSNEIKIKDDMRIKSVPVSGKRRRVTAKKR